MSASLSIIYLIYNVFDCDNIFYVNEFDINYLTIIENDTKA